MDAAFFSVVLRRYSRTNRYTAAILAYVFGAGAAMTLLAPNFGKLVKKQASLEGEYRQLQSRLRGNAESVAFYGGIDKEGRLIRNKFAELVKHRGRLLATQWRFGVVQVCVCDGGGGEGDMCMWLCGCGAWCCESLFCMPGTCITAHAL